MPTQSPPPMPPIEHSRMPAARTRAMNVLVCSTYAALVLLMWAPHTLFSGFNYETQFAYRSEARRWFEGFIFEGDPMRIHTSTFYHLSHLLGDLAGVGGSWVPYQVVYAGLWCARGLLVFLLVRRLVPGGPLVAYVTGALVLVHASDNALQWAGQMNQFGFIFWMLLASFVASRALDATRPRTATVLALLATALVHMSLWSYESQLPLLVLIPPLLLAVQKPSRARALLVAVPWYGILLVYLALTSIGYQTGQAGGYQQAVMRQDWSASALLSDWWFNIHASVSVWEWLRGPARPADVWFAVAAMAVFVAGGALAWRSLRRAPSSDRHPSPSPRTLLIMAAAGALLLVASFPVYLLLDSARSLWRTQFLSGIGSAILLTAAIALAARALPRRAAVPALLVLGAVVVGTGSAAALQLGREHRLGWERHRAVIRAILAVAPSVEPGTYVVLLNVPRAADPFGDVMWLEMALRLVYPGRKVSAGYYLDDGTPAVGQHMALALGTWIWDGTRVLPDVGEVGLDKTLILSLESDGRVSVVDQLPDRLCMTGCDPTAYHPHARIGARLSERAVRRYRLEER
jgi:hypothetical protein